MTEVTYRYIIDELNKRSIRHEVHSFTSGTKMIDIWCDGHFYVIQIDSESVGISEITENSPGFDTKPDAVFYNSEDAIKQFDTLLL